MGKPGGCGRITNLEVRSGRPARSRTTEGLAFTVPVGVAGRRNDGGWRGGHVALERHRAVDPQEVRNAHQPQVVRTVECDAGSLAEEGPGGGGSTRADGHRSAGPGGAG